MMMMTDEPSPALIVFLAVLLCSPLHAADKPQVPLTAPREDPPLSEPEVAPRGRHAPRDISYSDWQKLCFKVPGKDTLCRTSTIGTWDTGQMAIRIDVIERQGSARLQILLPVGLYLQSGVKLKVDNGARELVVPYSWCFSNLCVAAAPASGDVISALEKSQELLVDVVDTNLVNLTATVPTARFAAAYTGAPARTVEQVIDE
jgi:invasion protein IalB